ncbi:MAG: YetF domain-containing protein [Bacteroidota bacterium]
MSQPTWLAIITNCLGIFVSALVVTRVAGLRTFAKMSSIDFASTIAIGSILASTILSEKTTWWQGSLAIATIVALQVGSARLMKSNKWFNKVASNQPLLLMRNGTIIQRNLDKSGVSKEDLMAKLREANALHLADVKAVIFETTGDVAVLHGQNEQDIDDDLLYGVAPLDEQH